MNKNVYVGNLNYRLRDEDLKQIFADFGEVVSAKVIMDRDSGRSKGFGFVEMGDEESAQKAIDSLDGQDVEGRAMNVKAARPRPAR
ncbi:MAG: RNA-binding protein [Halobacteriovoraceae bacterium]|nr:RNA-binding protein [Halobacteriovoraceae bacterium]|tara:strand:+ start:119 stop:376 length:258 start_codon:yes stop_codon:yes gene_type:complete